MIQGASRIDLNSTLPPDSGRVLMEATAVNDVGQIVGYGSFKGQIRGLLLNPAPVP